MKRKVPEATPEVSIPKDSESAVEQDVVASETVQVSEGIEPPQSGDGSGAGLMQKVEAVAEAVVDEVNTVVEPARRRVGEYVGKAVYGSCYYAAYGVVYGALSLARLVPMDNVVGRAIRDGAADARSAAARTGDAVDAEGLAMAEPTPAGA